MKNLRAIHRFVTLFVVTFTLFLGVTGTMIQLIDLRSIVTHAPATDANVRAMRESFDGPGDYAVRQTSDYAAMALPPGDDLTIMAGTVLTQARRVVGAAPLSYLELRMDGDRPVGQVGVGGGHARFDARSGALLERTREDRIEDQSPTSDRNTFKRLHRMTTFGNWALFINIIVAIGLAILIVTGVLIWWKLHAIRRKIRRPSVFWLGGGLWRSLHRSIAVAAALFLCVVVLSGAWLAIECLGLAVYFANHPPGTVASPEIGPVQDEAVAREMKITLAAVGRVAPGAPIKVLRLRDYGGYHQGVVVTGGDDSRQLAFDATSGRAMSETEPGYPPVPFPFGWQAHQTAKAIHRGSYFGLTGRIMDLLSGLSMIYLSISGIEMYWMMWRKRKLAKRGTLLWR